MIIGGNTNANSTADAPLRHETSLGIRILAIAQPSLIQLVLVIDDIPMALITLSPENNGV
jgi:hypothetical protein